jgi:3-oxoadipate enol-lactonase
MTGELKRLRRFMRPLPPREAMPPAPPPGLPPGLIMGLEGRGETFVRHHVGPPGVPVLLLLHGWTASADLQWATAYPALTERYSVIAVDHRGHGRGIRSEEPFSLEACADDAAAVVTALAPGRRVVAVGYSMGGPITMHLWRRHPALVAGIVLEATALEWQTSREDRLRWRMLAFAERILRSRSLHRWVQRWLREEVRANPALEAWVPWMMAELRRTDPIAVVEAGHALRHYDARPFAPSVDVPAAVVVTTEDNVVRPVKQRALAHALRAETFELRGDHDVCWARASEFSATTRTAVDWVVSAIERREGESSLRLA